MAIYAQPSASFEAIASGFPTGLVGTIGVRILDNVGGTSVARTTAGITEIVAGGGVYAKALTAPSTAGQYSVVWDDGSISGPADVVTEDLTVTGFVPTPAGGADLTTLSAVRARLEVPAAETGRDALISAYITSASAHIMRDTDREFAPAAGAATRRRRVYPNRRLRSAVLLDLAPYDLRSTTSVQLNPEETSPKALTANTDYTLEPAENTLGVYSHLLISPYVTFTSAIYIRFGYALLDVAGAWGFATVPPEVEEACIDTVCSWLRRDFPQFGIADIDEGRGLAPVRAGTYSIPPAALKKLQPFRRPPCR